jgi:hypothetical protein
MLLKKVVPEFHDVLKKLFSGLPALLVRVLAIIDQKVALAVRADALRPRAESGDALRLEFLLADKMLRAIRQILERVDAGIRAPTT